MLDNAFIMMMHNAQ